MGNSKGKLVVKDRTRGRTTTEAKIYHPADVSVSAQPDRDGRFRVIEQRRSGGNRRLMVDRSDMERLRDAGATIMYDGRRGR